MVVSVVSFTHSNGHNEQQCTRMSETEDNDLVSKLAISHILCIWLVCLVSHICMESMDLFIQTLLNSV